MMEDPMVHRPSEAESSSVKPTAAANSSRQALKCPRRDSMNTKFCYYNNYSLTQPRHFCRNCKRCWTQGGVLRNVPVGGGCRKNKRVKQMPAFSIEPGALVPMIDPVGLFPAPASASLHNATALISTPGFADQHPSALSLTSQSHLLSTAFSRVQKSHREQQQAVHFSTIGTQPPPSRLLPFINMQHMQLLYPGPEQDPPMHELCHVSFASDTATLASTEEQLGSFGGRIVESRLAICDPHMLRQDGHLGLHLRNSTALQASDEANWAAPHLRPRSCLYDCSTSAEPQSFNFWNQSDPWADTSTTPSTVL